MSSTRQTDHSHHHDEHHDDDEEEAHGHGHHDHGHAPANFGRAFAIGIALNIVYILAEAFTAFGQTPWHSWPMLGTILATCLG